MCWLRRLGLHYFESPYGGRDLAGVAFEHPRNIRQGVLHGPVRAQVSGSLPVFAPPPDSCLLGVRYAPRYSRPSVSAPQRGGTAREGALVRDEEGEGRTEEGGGRGGGRRMIQVGGRRMAARNEEE